MENSDKQLENIKDNAELQKLKVQEFKSRLLKTYKHLSKWARKKDIHCYRIYDKDIPSIPLFIELYSSIDGECYLNVSIYRCSFDDDEKIFSLKGKVFFCAELLSVKKENVFIKVREKKKGSSQYEKIDSKRSVRFVVREGKANIYINISDYLDVGLFLDHRPLRMYVYENAKDKDVLNLFCYTASFSIQAMLGGAKTVTSVDASNTALKRAQENMQLNGIQESDKFVLKRADVLFFLSLACKEKRRWDVIICDAPTFSDSKGRKETFDVNKDYIKLCTLCVQLLNLNGVLYFSSNSKRLKFDSSLLQSQLDFPLFIKDISIASIPEDFRNKKIHKAWKIKREG